MVISTVDTLAFFGCLASAAKPPSTKSVSASVVTPSGLQPSRKSVAGQRAITAYARKGILTLTQLAHTFRPRRRGKRSSAPSKKRYLALQALALRDRRVYVLGAPQIPTSEVRIYLDLEGTTGDGFVYLIGMIVCEGTAQTVYSFWADTKDQEASIFGEFLSVVGRYREVRIYAYGGYERAFLKRMRRTSRQKQSSRVLLMTKYAL